MPNPITLRRFRRLPDGEEINDEVSCFMSFHDAVMQLYFAYGTQLENIVSIEQKRHRDGSEAIAIKDVSNKIILQYKTII